MFVVSPLAIWLRSVSSQSLAGAVGNELHKLATRVGDVRKASIHAGEIQFDVGGMTRRQQPRKSSASGGGGKVSSMEVNPVRQQQTRSPLGHQIQTPREERDDDDNGDEACDEVLPPAVLTASVAGERSSVRAKQQNSSAPGSPTSSGGDSRSNSPNHYSGCGHHRKNKSSLLDVEPEPDDDDEEGDGNGGSNDNSNGLGIEGKDKAMI